MRQCICFVTLPRRYPHSTVAVTITVNSLFKDFEQYENETNDLEAESGEEVEETSDVLGEEITILIEMNCLHT